MPSSTAGDESAKRSRSDAPLPPNQRHHAVCGPALRPVPRLPNLRQQTRRGRPARRDARKRRADRGGRHPEAVRNDRDHHAARQYRGLVFGADLRAGVRLREDVAQRLRSRGEDRRPARGDQRAGARRAIRAGEGGFGSGARQVRPRRGHREALGRDASIARGFGAVDHRAGAEHADPGGGGQGRGPARQELRSFDSVQNHCCAL